MRYHIDTIPVWDAMKLGGECPLCAIRRKTELQEVQRFLGASVMEPDTRIQVNAKGFCVHHQQMLFAEQNRLGLALMMHSHLKETEAALHKLLPRLLKAGQEYGATNAITQLTSKGVQSKKALAALADELKQLSSSCIICDSLEGNVRRYAATFLYLWKTDLEFQKAFAASKGVCLPDAALLAEMAPQELSSKETAAFLEILAGLLETNLKRVEDELEWFTLKFDYRNTDKPWGNSKDAVERTVNKLRGWCVGEEPNPKK